MKKIFKEGHMATVYVENDTAYKAYDDFYPEEWIDKEIYIHDILLEKTSLNVTKMYKTGAHEIKMPFLNQNTLDTGIDEKFDNVKLIDFVHLQTQINAYMALELENAHVVFKRWILMSQLGKDIKNIALDVLDNLEYKNHLCHFDYQPSHVVSFEKKYFVVDWIHAKLANPILDMASTYIILRLKSYKLAHQYLYKVIDMTDSKLEDIFKVVPLMAAIKMIETDDIFKHKVLTTLVFDPKNKVII
ncbi:hypothetical protein [Mariniplasma anaerobium]|uniref:Aminoglycoside phosphotransferase domain-containing protein n=1 Tax=Mariniplasma anaerobium TaxID=2735436 RepID=A0A7U9THL2_9MOLU|nr:hypothetical protein [Mariniplasma anaerobium]BCR36621.1 hypothetical protein MPAN_015140 [Mariniplasma anaerobium]